MFQHRAATFAFLLVLAGCAAQDEAASTPPDTDPVIAQLKQAAAADTTSWQAQINLSAELRRKDRLQEAGEAAQKAFMLAPEPGTEARLELAKVYAAAEQPASAINLVKEVEKKKRAGEPADEVKIAEVYAVLEDPNSVFRWLERAVTAGSPNVAGLRTNPEFNGVHADKRWQELMAKLPQ